MIQNKIIHTQLNPRTLKLNQISKSLQFNNTTMLNNHTTLKTTLHYSYTNLKQHKNTTHNHNIKKMTHFKQH